MAYQDLEALDQFGEAFVRRVRDETLAEVDGILTGRAHPAWERELHASIVRSLDEEQRALLRHVVAVALDHAIHNALWFIESTPALTLEVTTPDGRRHDLVEISDGLSGEIFTEDGWIARFSRDKDPGSSLLY